ncbi:MAG: glycosyltransferase family 4 protein [Actinomyces urogenitalis]|uniref:glycosyltransferase family 4 protein n=1 Tax=Actinomyces urogenitalis TaxID=103621 RepID=UPI0006600A8C|nr:glycosyltransferase family 4 protein [Actinomyces urogenitalis]MBS6073113.1 glycosyltransferase family 4 protein [Actinomyces urogenitalis]MDU6151259.1 glycosyltransferase family 4 protein [Actinomyces urogenitalis]MDU7427171.1 glycosyltransferase family 4 protein [Actinomyces urogenitalis]
MTSRVEPERRRLRVLEVCGSAAGGVRAHVADCARLLAEAGHDVIVEAPASVLDGAPLGAARSEVLQIGPRPGPGDLLVLARLRRLGRRADVVHAHGLRAGALAALALGRRRTRLVVTEHNLPVGGRLTTATGRALAGVVAARSDQVLAVSPDLLAQARELGAREAELAVIPASGHVQQEALDAAAVQEVWPEGYRVLTVARLAPQKGLDLLLDAAAQLADAVTEAGGEGGATSLTWAVAGDGPQADELAARIAREQLPVRLLGRRGDVSSLMQAADVVVQTSLWEGQPITIQEALAAGAAIVATDVGGTGVTARGGAQLVSPSSQAVAQAVARLLADDGARRQAQDRARQAARELPDHAALAAQLQRVLDPGV